jgi:hypothetical protein
LVVETDISGEIFKGVTLDGVDAEAGVRLHNGESTGNCIHITLASRSIGKSRRWIRDVAATTNRRFCARRTEELLGATTLLNDLNETGLQLFDRRNVVGKDTHLTRLGGNVDLDTVSRRIAISQSRGKANVVGSPEDRNVHVGRLEEVLYAWNKKMSAIDLSEQNKRYLSLMN